MIGPQRAMRICCLGVYDWSLKSNEDFLPSCRLWLVLKEKWQHFALVSMIGPQRAMTTCCLGVYDWSPKSNDDLLPWCLWLISPPDCRAPQSPTLSRAVSTRGRETFIFIHKEENCWHNHRKTDDYVYTLVFLLYVYVFVLVTTKEIHFNFLFYFERSEKRYYSQKCSVEWAMC